MTKARTSIIVKFSSAWCLNFKDSPDLQSRPSTALSLDARVVQYSAKTPWESVDVVPLSKLCLDVSIPAPPRFRFPMPLGPIVGSPGNQSP